MTRTDTACARCDSRLEHGDLRCPVCLHGVPTPMSGVRSALRVQVLRCSGCGAAVSYDVFSRSTRCAFCGSEIRIEEPEDPLEQPESYLPFTVGPAEAKARFRGWLDDLGWFRPSDLGSASTVESLRPMWWVGWVCSGTALVSWAVDSDAGSRRARWAPHAGQARLAIQDLVVSASRGLSVAEAAALVGSYRLDTAGDEADGPEEAVVERYDLRRSAARRQVESALDRLFVRRLQREHIPGKRFRNLHKAVVLRNLVTRRVAFPAYVLAYRHRGDLYRVVMSGQDTSRLVGSAPYSVAKIVAVIAGGIAALAFVIIALIAALVGR